MAATKKAPSIDFNQFTIAASSALAQAMATKKLPRGPIIIGIIWWPEGGTRPGSFGAQVGSQG